MEHIKDLGVAAARLLLGYLLGGEAFAGGSLEAQMQATGITRRQTFYEARAQLVGKGYIEARRNSRGVDVSLSSSTVAGWGGVVGGGRVVSGRCAECVCNECLEGSCTGSTGCFNGRGLSEVTESVTSESVTLPSEVTESVTSGEVIQQKVLHHEVTESVTSLHDTTESVTSLLGRCILIDELDDTGPETSRSSPFQKRRAEQIVLIREAWEKFYPQDPYPLTGDNAKSFLSWCGNSAETCYERLQEIAHVKPGLDGPIAYVRKSLRNWGADRTTTSIVAGRGRAVSGPLRGAAAYFPGGDIPLPSEEWLEEVRELHTEAESKKRERGWEE